MSRKPDYRLGFLDKVTDDKDPRVGAGWKNDDGSISIVIDPFIRVPDDRTNLVITLFPIRQAEAVE